MSLLLLTYLVYFVKEGETAYYERKHDADLIFAVNGVGSYFGDVDFTLAGGTPDAKRFYSVKALSDVTVLALHKKDLYTLDEEFKVEVQEFFKRSETHERKLESYLKEANKWYDKSKPINEEIESSVSQQQLEEIDEEEEDYLERQRSESVKKKREPRGIGRVLNTVKMDTESHHRWKTEDSSPFSKQVSSVLPVNEEIEDKSLS